MQTVEQRRAREREYSRKYRVENREKILAYRKSHPELHRKASRDWQRRYRSSPKYAADLEKRRAAMRIHTKRMYGYPDPTRPMPTHCECCGMLPGGRWKRLHLDHNHETGKFRGWLCGRCNPAIGLLGDNRAGIRLADAYLERAGEI